MVLCCDCYSAFRVFCIAVAINVINFIVTPISYSTTQWAVSEETASDCKSFLFIGLNEYKSGTSGDGCAKEDYEVKDVDCDNLDLTDDECTQFEDAVGLAGAAVACVVLSLVFKLLLTWLAFGNRHNRVLWILTIVSAGGDIVFGCVAFASCGNYQMVMDEFPEPLGSYDLGFGWGLMLLAGFLAWICAILGAVILVKGIGENSATQKDDNVA